MSRKKSTAANSPLYSPEIGVEAETPHNIGGELPTLPMCPPLGGGTLGEVSWGVSPTPISPAGELGRKLGRKPGRKSKKKPLTIIEDTREQTPLMDWPEGVAVEVGTLHTGDYSIKGWEACFAIERKSLADFAGTMIGGYEANDEKPRKRFNRELERMRHFDLAAVIVTATADEVLAFRHHCGMDAHGALWGFALSIFATYGVPVFFLDDEKTAARWIADLARHYVTVRTKKHFTKTDLAANTFAAWEF